MNGRDTYTHSSLCAPHWSSRGAIFWQLIHGCAKKSSRHEHGSAVQHSSSSPPTRLAWVEKTMCVCVCFHMCVWRLGWLTATSFAYSRPLPLALFSLSLSLSHCRHRKSTAERAILTEREAARERERERSWLIKGWLSRERAVCQSPPLPPDRLLADSQGLACKPTSHISP